MENSTNGNELFENAENTASENNSEIKEVEADGGDKSVTENIDLSETETDLKESARPENTKKEERKEKRLAKKERKNAEKALRKETRQLKKEARKEKKANAAEAVLFNKPEDSARIEEKIETEIKKPIMFSPAIMIVSILLAILITFMSTFALLDRRYRAEYNDFVASFEKSDYYTLEYVKSLFAAYYIGDLSELSDEEIMDALISAYVLKTGDEYAYYWNKDEYTDYMAQMSGDGVGIGVLVNWLEEEKAIDILMVHPGSPAEKAGIEAGDVIVAIGDKKVSDIGYDNAVGLIKGEIGTSVSLTLVSSGEEKTVNVKRDAFVTVSVVSKMLSDEKTGYIRILQFDGTTTEQFAKAYLELSENGAQHFVFDVRDNPGGALDSVMGVLSFLLGDGIPLIEVSDKSGEKYTENSDRSIYCTDKYSGSVDGSFKHSGKTVVITNGNTASAGELFTACMHEASNDVITVGLKTYGKGVMQRTFDLPNGGAIKLTYSMYTAPGVKNYDVVGLIPDIEQKLSDEAANKNLFRLSEKEDDQLQRALGALYGESVGKK